MPGDEPAAPAWAFRRPGTASLSIDGSRIRYRVTGSGETVLLLHGVGRSLEDWNEQHDLLSGRFRVLSLDLPGFAFSELSQRPATLSGIAAMLPAVLDELKIAGPVHVVGNSLGGAVAMTFAVQYPGRSASLVLVSSAGFGREVSLALRLLAIAPTGLSRLRATRIGSRRVTRALFHDRRFATADRVDRALALGRQPGHSDTLLEVIRSLGSFRGVDEGWRLLLLARLRALQIPILVLWGARDRVLPASHLENAAELLPGSDTHLFPATGHLPMIERAGEFARLVATFIGKHPISSTGIVS